MLRSCDRMFHNKCPQKTENAMSSWLRCWRISLLSYVSEQEGQLGTGGADDDGDSFYINI